MGGLEIRELECFLALSEELHFGRAAERMYVSQARVSQLLRSLETRVGARLFERTSRRVRLTPLGTRFLADLSPAYDSLRQAVESATAAARGVTGVLRAGFVGTPHQIVMEIVAAFQARHPGSAVEVCEMPFSDPFGPMLRGEVDVAFVCEPVAEPGLVLGAKVNSEPQSLAVSTRHPFAGRVSISAEELADCRFVQIAEPAPPYWRELFSPTVTPGGRPVPRGPVAATMQEGLCLIAANQGVLVLCALTADYHSRPDIVFVPVEGLPRSMLSLVWHADGETAMVRAFRQVTAERVSGEVLQGGPMISA
ncbi:LysR family transcriptional regulator [Streptosporangium sp. KLBMP 9127]|nr:LysR family transcriptional regulator [Streptosporangium sp. KLBMP 9127]